MKPVLPELGGFFLKTGVELLVAVWVCLLKLFKQALPERLELRAPVKLAHLGVVDEELPELPGLRAVDLAAGLAPHLLDVVLPEQGAGPLGIDGSGQGVALGAPLREQGV